MAENPERVLIISNPSSSRAKEVQRFIIDPLVNDPPVGKEMVYFTVTSKDRMVTAQQIAGVIQPNDRIIVAGGDGTGNVAINGIMNATDSTGVRIGFLPYGNFNDMASTFTDPSVKKQPRRLIESEKSASVHPLDIMVNQQHHHYGLLYATVGWTALAAANFDKPGKRSDLQNRKQTNLLSNLTDLAKLYFKTRKNSFLPPFHRDGFKIQTNTTDILAINGPIMGQIICSRQDMYAGQTFLRHDLDVSSFFANSNLLGRSALNYLLDTRLQLPGTNRTEDTLYFEHTSELPIQIDGEVFRLSDVNSLSITKDQTPDARTITVITV